MMRYLLPFVILVYSMGFAGFGYWNGVHDTLVKDPEQYQEVCSKMWPFPKYKCEELD